MWSLKPRREILFRNDIVTTSIQQLTKQLSYIILLFIIRLCLIFLLLLCNCCTVIYCTMCPYFLYCCEGDALHVPVRIFPFWDICLNFSHIVVLAKVPLVAVSSGLHIYTFIIFLTSCLQTACSTSRRCCGRRSPDCRSRHGTTYYSSRQVELPWPAGPAPGQLFFWGFFKFKHLNTFTPRAQSSSWGFIQHFAAKLCNFTNFNMLFLAVVMDFVLLAYVKIQPIAGIIYCPTLSLIVVQTGKLC